MKICPISYEPIQESQQYSAKGLRLLSPVLTRLNDFPYTAEEQRREAEARSSKLSIQGIQPKLSVALNIKKAVFEIVDRGGRTILKPQVERYRQLPENEDLSMRLAALAGIEVPLHGLIYSKGGSFTYFVKRFDRAGQKTKYHVEDFAQLSGENRDTKYKSSMERVADVIERFCTFPVLEKLKLFKRTLFSFLIGNDDMHLKNFSILVKDDKIELSPAYDLVNSTLVLASPKEELALPLRGRKNRLSRNDLVQYFAMERLELNQRMCDQVLQEFQLAIPQWKEFIHRSFLSLELRDGYHTILNERAKRIGL